MINIIHVVEGLQSLILEVFIRNYRSIFKAHVYLESNTASNCGGGLYLKCTLMTAYDNVSMFFLLTMSLKVSIIIMELEVEPCT